MTEVTSLGSDVAASISDVTSQIRDVTTNAPTDITHENSAQTETSAVNAVYIDGKCGGRYGSD